MVQSLKTNQYQMQDRSRGGFKNDRERPAPKLDCAVAVSSLTL
ncbi:hypothetical protein HMPREF0239_01122 [Clostridium sp. ATCC BAA-442]|nr:hypothetical protein HMPREF0239_01122 [Clostridium sp. ATCC BAA-442]